MSFHLYRINELYSNADGTNQFIELTVDDYDGQGFWAGHFIRVTQSGVSHSLTFTADLPSEATARCRAPQATTACRAAPATTPSMAARAWTLWSIQARAPTIR